MGVSLECYRFRIGCHQPRDIVIRKYRVKSMKNNFMQTLPFLLAASLFNCFPQHLISLPMDNNIQNSLYQPGLFGFNASATNKVCHSLNGNRRQQGLVLASWNCGRSLMQKIDDIKLFIQIHRPHLLAISEADFHGKKLEKIL